MVDKLCPKCGEYLDFCEFSKKKSNIDGLQCWCKNCNEKYNLKYRRTINGLCSRIYASQVLHSKNRNHSIPEYSKNDLKEWLASQRLFYEIYDKWVESNYGKKLIPSVDRINDNEGYSIDNIQLMTWGENELRAYSCRKDGIIKGQSVSVLQFDLDDNFIKEYHSQSQAYRETGVGQWNISGVCIGRKETAGGFKWKYKNEKK